MPDNDAAAPAAAPAPARAWQIVLEKIESDLLEGALGPGDRLPPERELAANLGVGRSSVREALRVLEVMGLIRTGTGSGPSAGAIIIATPAGRHVRTAAAAGRRARVSPSTTSCARASFWSPPWRMRSPRTRHATTAPARVIVDAMDAEGLTPAEFLSLDAQLHLALAEASGNVVIAAMMGGLRTAIESYVLAGAERIPDWDAAATRLRSEHHAILDAIDSGDAIAARTLIHDHITGYYAEAGLART